MALRLQRLSLLMRTVPQRTMRAVGSSNYPMPIPLAQQPLEFVRQQQPHRLTARSRSGSSKLGVTARRPRLVHAAAEEAAEASTSSAASSSPDDVNQPGREEQQRAEASSSSSGAGDAGPASSSSSSGSDAAAAADPKSFDLHLPASVSGTTGLDALDDVELQQQAQDWGYTRLGRSFPEGVSLVALAESLDPQHFEISPLKAFGGLAAPLLLIAAGCAWQAYMHSICPLWQQLLCWVAVGTGYFGAFQAAADCAHFAFWPQEPAVQDLIGAVLMAPALIPYEGWRLQHFNHLLHPNMLRQDSPLWHPTTVSDVSSLPPWRRLLARLAAATPLRFASRGLVGWAAAWDGLDLRRHPPASRPWVLLSWAAPLAFAGLAWPALLAGGGFERLVGWWLMPWLVFNGWLGLLSIAQHTAPHIPVVEEGYEYDHGQAIVNGTVTLLLPRWLESLVSAANLGLPRMLSISIPRYNIRAAHEELRAKLGPYLTEANLFDPTLLRNLWTRWLVYDEGRRRYVDFDGAEEAAAAAAGAAGAGERLAPAA